MWFFRSPQIVFGEDALSYLDQISGKRAFIVTDPLMQELGFVKKVQARLGAAGIESMVFAEVEPESSLQTVEKCASAMSAYEPD
jgi:acetaldehyde dehydrogenase/alcohol dehydrogenase